MSGNPQFFSPQARQAAAEKRRRRFEEQPPKGAPEIFVVRMVRPKQPFGWEIRKYGSFVVRKSDNCFATQAEAQAAGEKALAALAVMTDYSCSLSTPKLGE